MSGRQRALLVLLLTGLWAASANASTLRCTHVTKQFCDADGCNRIEPKTYNTISTDPALFSRCDSIGCDGYEYVVTRSGVYLTFEVPGRGLMAKMSEDGSEYVEIATLTTGVYISHGYCTTNDG